MRNKGKGGEIKSSSSRGLSSWTRWSKKLIMQRSDIKRNGQ
jgi:hypothetical protein